MTKGLWRKKAYRARSNEEGFILVTVLLVIALLFPLVLAFNSRVQLNLTQAENFRDSVQALRIARAGVEGAIGILRQDDPTYDSRRDKWAMTFPSVSLTEGGVLTVKIVDEDGRLAINNLIAGNEQKAARTDGQAATPPVKATQGQLTGQNKPPLKADEVNRDLEKQVKALISQMEGRPEITDALIDWLDENDEVTGSDGAEEDYYRSVRSHCKNGSLDSVDELLMIKGFDKDLVIDKKLRDYVTIARTDGGLNINTAPVEVLKAVVGTQTSLLAQPLSESDIEDLVRYRDEHEIKDIRDIASAVKISQTQLGSVSSILKVKSSYFTVSSRYTIGKVVKNVEALLKRDGSTVSIISWREF